MGSTRREFLAVTGSIVTAVWAFLSDLRRPFRSRVARAQSGWSLRRATHNDSANLRDIFNAQHAAGLFPFTELIQPWTEEKAARVLDTYTGTLVLSFNDELVGFVAFVDYTRPETASSIAPEADPEVKILAVRVDQLSREQRVAAIKRLAVAASRDLQRQGFGGCEATIHARTGFEDLFAGHLEVKRVNDLDGVAEAKLVRFRIGEVVEELEAEGL